MPKDILVDKPVDGWAGCLRKGPSDKSSWERKGADIRTLRRNALAEAGIYPFGTQTVISVMSIPKGKEASKVLSWHFSGEMLSSPRTKSRRDSLIASFLSADRKSGKVAPTENVIVFWKPFDYHARWSCWNDWKKDADAVLIKAGLLEEKRKKRKDD